MKVMHEANWEASLKATSHKVVSIANQIQGLIRELESSCEKVQACYEWYNKIYPKAGGYDLSPLIEFRRLYPALSIQDMRNGKDEYSAIKMYLEPIREDCLGFIDAFELEQLHKTHLAGDPTYKAGNFLSRYFAAAFHFGFRNASVGRFKRRSDQ